MFCCPALINEQNNIREQIAVTIEKWNLPYRDVGYLPATNIKKLWIEALEASYSDRKTTLNIDRIQLLVSDYWLANKENRRKSLKAAEKTCGRSSQKIQVSL